MKKVYHVQCKLLELKEQCNMKNQKSVGSANYTEEGTEIKAEQSTK